MAVGGVGAVAGGVGHVGKGVFSGVRNVVPIGRRNTASTANDDVEDGYAIQDANGAGSVGSMLAAPSHSAHSDINGRIDYAPIPMTGASGAAGTPDFGQLQVTVTDVQGIPQDEKVHVQLHHGSKHHEKSHVSKNPSTGHNDVIFSLKTLPEAMNLVFSLVIKKSFGKDRVLGSADLDVWNLIHPGSQHTADATLNTGAGDIAVSLAWTPAANAASNVASASPTVSRTQPGSTSNASQLNVPDSPASAKSKSRFSMHRRRETTPSS